MIHSQIVFWFALFSIVSTAIAIVLFAVAPPGKRPPWLPWFLFHIGAYTAWLVVQAFLFFNIVLMNGEPGVLARGGTLLHLLFSLIILLSYPPFIVKLTGSEKPLSSPLLVLAAPALLVLTVLLAFMFKSVVLSIFINVLFNVYLLGLSLFGLVRLKSREVSGLRRAMHSFLRITIILYILLILMVPIAFIIPPELYADTSMFFTALFCSSWSLLIIRELLRGNERPLQGKSISEAFIRDYRISRRERDVLEKLLEGKTNRIIADELFISTRTVETHIYKIYRKAGASNKVELLRVLENT